VPTVAEYMAGYRVLFKLGIPSRTLENSFNVINRQIWTNKKQKARIGNLAEEATDECGLCGTAESTQHMLVECSEYSEKVWQELESLLNQAHIMEEGRIRLHIHNMLYNKQVSNIKQIRSTQVSILIQEVKRHMVLKRYQRSQNEFLNNVVYDSNRVIMHIRNVTQRVVSLHAYQGKSKDALCTLLEKIDENLQG